MSGSYYGGEPEGWGAGSEHGVAFKQLELPKYLAEVEQGGTVVDVGAGIGLCIGAEIYIARPDLKVIPVDPGFEAVEWGDVDFWGECLNITIDRFKAKDRAKLLDKKAWVGDLVTADAEDLPLESSSADLVVSYAAVPEYAYDYEAVLSECLRILKFGRVALHGPLPANVFERWDTLLKAAKSNGDVSEYESRSRMVTGSYGDRRKCSFTYLRK